VVLVRSNAESKILLVIRFKELCKLCVVGIRNLAEVLLSFINLTVEDASLITNKSKNELEGIDAKVLVYHIQPVLF